MGRRGAADLVVEYHWEVVARPEVGKGEKVLMPSAGAAVDHHHRRRPVGKVAKDLVIGVGGSIDGGDVERDVPRFGGKFSHGRNDRVCEDDSP